MIRIISIVLSLFSILNLYAGDLKPPLSIPSAQVLPKGVRNLNLKGIITGADNKYNSNGDDVVLADPFFKELTFGDIIEGTPDPVDRAALRQKMYAMGKSESDSFGETTGQVNIEAGVTVPIIAYGLTEKVTIAAAFPFTKSSLNIDTGVIQKNEELHNAIREELGKTPGKIDEFNNTMIDPVSKKLRDLNYQPLENETATKLGDIKLVSKYRAYNSKLNRTVLSFEVTLPTGKEADVNKLVDVPGGDGQLDTGIAINHDITLNNGLTFLLGAGYTIQHQDTVERRIPFMSTSKLTEDVDFAVERDLGDIAITQFGMKYKLLGFTLGGAYSLQYKERDKYSGTAYEEYRYRWLEKETEQVMQSASLNLSYDTIDLFKEGKFAAPLLVGVTHTEVFAGKNVVNNALTTFDVSLFF